MKEVRTETIYKCDVCGREYRNKEWCEMCEESHKYFFISLTLTEPSNPDYWSVVISDSSLMDMKNMKKGEVYTAYGNEGTEYYYRRWSTRVKKENSEKARKRLLVEALSMLTVMSRALLPVLQLDNFDTDDKGDGNDEK